jgi:hypothetical protein
MHTFTTGDHQISFRDFLKPMRIDELPEETVRAFTANANRFPMGQLLACSEPEGLDTPTLFLDCARGAFFVATINLLLDMHAAHLDAQAQERQRKALQAQHYKAQRTALYGGSAASRHLGRVSDIIRQKTARIINAANGVSE